MIEREIPLTPASSLATLPRRIAVVPARPPVIGANLDSIARKGLHWLTHLAIGMAAGLLCASASSAAGENWPVITAGDLAAARQLIEQNHPGASPVLHDLEFQARLRRGYMLALSRSNVVASYGGYRATLQGFAHAFRDEHVWSNPATKAAVYRWPGFLVSKQGSRWIIVEAKGEQQLLEGAELLACDGTPVKDLARRRLGRFYAEWDIPAQQKSQAPRLLLDDGNSFLNPIASCTVRMLGKPKPVALSWHDISLRELSPKFHSAVGFGQAGYGVRRFAQGTWISLQGLDDRAPAVLQQVRDRLGEIRRSRLVVVDVRGNGGGNSAYGDELARLLLGDAYVESIAPAAGDDACSEVWRVSSGNLETLRQYREKFGATLSPAYVKETDLLIARMEAAENQGRVFAPPLHCARPRPTARTTRPRAPAPFRMIILTDGACFSSCLVMTDEFRRLGAVQVGEATDGGTRYAEVREEKLPSGLSVFSTLQAYYPSYPARFGPFVPEMVFAGNIADTSAVERWLSARFAIGR